MNDEEPTLYKVPFRGGTLEVWSDTSPGRMAIIAQLSLADPRYDAFYRAAGVTLVDPHGRVVFPHGQKQQDRAEEAPEADQRPGDVPQEGPVAVRKPEGGDPTVAGDPGSGAAEGDASPGPEEATSGGDVFDLFGA